MQKLLNKPFRHVQFREAMPKSKKFFRGLGALSTIQDFRIIGADLGREHAHPYLLDFRLGAPELNELTQV